MARLIDGLFSKGFETLRLLVFHPDFSEELSDAIRAKGGVDRAIRALHREFFPNKTEKVCEIAPMDVDNPYRMSVDEQILALRHANDEEGWGIADEVFDRLAATAPAWPTGRYAFRSFRIRFLRGTPGVEQTFALHSQRIRKVFEGRFAQSASFPSVVSGRIRLFNGNNTHEPVVEWIVFDLYEEGLQDPDSTRLPIYAIRSMRSLADELLVFAWLFPSFLQDHGVDHDEIAAIFAAGYQVNIGMSTWKRVPFLCFGRIGSGDMLEMDTADEKDRSRTVVPAYR